MSQAGTAQGNTTEDVGGADGPFRRSHLGCPRRPDGAVKTDQGLLHFTALQGDLDRGLDSECHLVAAL